jgi:hypothetical protein
LSGRIKDYVMDIQTRKIAFVQEFLKLQNEELLTCLEKLLRTDRSTESNDFKPMTMAEFKGRIDQSMDDSEKDRLITSRDLMTEIEKWD